MCSERAPRKAVPLAAIALAAALALLAAGCGKKGDPKPPFRPIPKAVSDLEASQRDGEVLLRFSYPQTTTAGQALPALVRVEVWEMARPLPPPAPAAATPPATVAPAGSEPAASAAPEVKPASGEAPAATPPPAATSSATPPGAATPPGTPPPSPPSTPAVAAPPAVDPREFAGAATLQLKLTGDEIAAATAGAKIAITLQLPTPLPEPAEVRVFAVKTASERETSALSNLVALPLRTPPHAPAGLTLTAKVDGVDVGWTATGDGIEGFDVYRRDAASKEFGEPLSFAAADARTLHDPGAAYGHRYVYAVAAVGARRPLLESAIAETREIDYRDRFAPPTPGHLVALADPGRVRLVWDASEAADLAGYRIARRRGEGEWETVTPEPIAAAEYVDSGLTAGESVAYRVSAVDQLGNESAPAEAATTVPR
jgi:hypothetical protein